MEKRRIYWPYGNPKFDAWEIESSAGLLVLRRNHPLVRGSSNCQGWDLWLDGKYLGAVGSRSLSELATLSRQSLKRLVLEACCGKHADFSSGPLRVSRPGWGGSRPNAGRPRKAKDRRVDLATTVDLHTLELIDKHRGEASRGQYIDLLVQGKVSR